MTASEVVYCFLKSTGRQMPFMDLLATVDEDEVEEICEDCWWRRALYFFFTRYDADALFPFPSVGLNTVDDI